MMLFRFHFSGARFRSFPRRFHAYEGNWRFISFSFLPRFLPVPFVSDFLSMHGKRETKPWSLRGVANRDKNQRRSNT
jgi:hypothetical protein